jgi:HSP20 family protein
VRLIGQGRTTGGHKITTFRNVPLPEGVKDEDITASYKDGILEIRAPIAREEEKPPVTNVPIARG